VTGKFLAREIQGAGEQFFALPVSPPWSLTSLFDGTVPQSRLDEIANVKRPGTN
jgi:hypothetical protein